jgi:hypothetical protein
MSATSETTYAIAGWPAPQPGLVPSRSIGPSPSLLRSVAAAFRKKRQMLEALQRRWRQRPAGCGGPQAPREDQPAGDSIWDDPLLWMLIMH